MTVVNIDRSFEIPYLNEYLGVWCMSDSAISGLLNVVMHMNWPDHMAEIAPAVAAAGDPAPFTEGATAVMEIKGTLMKQRTSMSGGTSTVAARRKLRELANDDSIGTIILQIDSPGGTVAGTKELADEVKAAAQKKPVIAYIEDLGASAAYWIASQATETYCNATAHVGSIGTFGVVYDMSDAAEKAGIKVHVINAGEFKGMGTPGTEVTDKQLAVLQESVSQLNEFFLSAVMEGRSMTREQVQAAATGRTWIGQSAETMGLVDGIMTFDQVLERAQQLQHGSNSRVAAHSFSSKEGIMSQSTTQPQPATVQEIKAVCPNASSDFVLAQLSASATVDQVKDAWMAELEAQAIAKEKAMEEENAKLKAELEAARKAEKAEHSHEPKKVGVKPVDFGADDDGSDILAQFAKTSSKSPTVQWKRLVSEHVRNGMTAADAMDRIDQEYPGLRHAMIQEQNNDPDWEEAIPGVQKR